VRVKVNVAGGIVLVIVGVIENVGVGVAVLVNVAGGVAVGVLVQAALHGNISILSIHRSTDSIGTSHVWKLMALRFVSMVFIGTTGPYPACLKSGFTPVKKSWYCVHAAGAIKEYE